MKMNSYTLKELTTKLIDGKHGGCESVKGSKYYFISVKDMRPYYIDLKDAKEIGKEDYLECNKRTKLSIGDTIYANSGDTIGKSLYIDNEDYIGNVTFQKSIAILSPNTSIVNQRYFYYLMKYNTGRLRNSSTGSAQKNLLLDTMNKFKVLIHEKTEQQKISEFISKYDNLLQIKYEEIYELEKLLDTYYNFYCNNEYDPEDYEIFKLKDICDIKTGKKDANFATVNGKYNFYTCSSDVYKCDEFEFDGKYVLVAGNGSFNVKNYNGKFNAYQRTYVIKCNDDINYALVYKAVDSNVERFTKRSNGSIVKFIRLSDIENIEVKIITNEKIRTSMNEILTLIQENYEFIEKIENDRDYYLKLLMSNSIKKEVE